jgi:transketolase
MPNRRELANAIRALSMDAVQQANSGHPGMPMGMADIAEVLWNDFLRHNPSDPRWPDRDRFILSNGHGSMLQYALLHLSGYDLPLEQLKRFRQLHSKTPGHPEVHETPGVETTTGPLGQGLANAVGFALAERILAQRFNRPSHSVVDHKTYVFLGDGCLMEGISHEAASLAGTLRLGKLIALYDDNGISIDGKVQGWFSDDTPKRFEAYGWRVLSNVDGHDANAVRQALLDAQNSTQPVLICCKTVIGFGSPAKAGSESSHGAPLGKDEIVASKAALQWPHGAFEIPADIYAGWDAKRKGAEQQSAWQEKFASYQNAHPELAAEFLRVQRGDLPADFPRLKQELIANANAAAQSIASRKASQMALESLVAAIPELIGGSADLAHSNYSIVKASKDVNAPAGGNYVYYGVREFAMTAIANGLALHGGLLPYTATFLVFSDYARNAVRLSALMKVRNIHVYTHDSIGLGEDGPTHQPVEHLASLRLIPNLDVWRPADAVESMVSWCAALEYQGPSALVFSRQNLPHQMRTEAQIAAIERGAYIALEAPASVELILLATGSELELAMQAARTLQAEGVGARVVSMPCSSRFDRQALEYREGVLPSWCRSRVAVEAASADYWRKYVGLDGAVIGMHSFGASAPDKALYAHFGITLEAVLAAARAQLKGAKGTPKSYEI